MRCRAIHTAAVLLGLAAPLRAESPIDLTWTLVAPGPAFVSLEAGVLTLEFSNDCLAEAGVRLTVLSAPGQPDALIVEAAATPLGCPEIFRPLRMRLALPGDVTPDAAQVYARKPADGQPPGEDGGSIGADITWLSVPPVGWTSALGGWLAVSSDCGASDVTARLLPETLTPSGQTEGVLAAPARCLAPGMQRLFRLSDARPDRVLNRATP